MQNKGELSIEILYAKEDCISYLSIMKYYFFPNIKDYSTERISFIRIEDKQAREIIEAMELKEEPINENGHIKYISKQAERAKKIRNKKPGNL